MRIISITKYVFIATGIGMLVGAYFLYANTQEFLKSALTADGTVVELVRARANDSVIYRPVVEFRAQDGSVVEFVSSSGSNPPGYSQGEVVGVLYQESSPEQARISGFFSLWGGAVILAGIGSAFFLFGFVMMLIGRLTAKKVEYLQRYGVPIRAKFQGVQFNSSLEVNGRNPYQITAQWENPATSEVHVFNSENIWFDPSDHIPGDEITVLIEKDNPKKYHVDISFLPKMAG